MALLQPYSNFWDDPEGLEANGYKAIDINVNHPVHPISIIFHGHTYINADKTDTYRNEGGPWKE